MKSKRPRPPVNSYLTVGVMNLNVNDQTSKRTFLELTYRTSALQKKYIEPRFTWALPVSPHLSLSSPSDAAYAAAYAYGLPIRPTSRHCQPPEVSVFFALSTHVGIRLKCNLYLLSFH